MFIHLLIICLMHRNSVQANESFLNDLNANTLQTKLQEWENKTLAKQYKVLEECKTLQENRKDFPIKTAAILAPIITSGGISLLHFIHDWRNAYYEGWACSSLLDDHCPSIATVTPHWPSLWDTRRKGSIEWALLFGGAVEVFFLCSLYQCYKRQCQIPLSVLVAFESQLEQKMMRSSQINYSVEKLEKDALSFDMDNFYQNWNAQFRVELGALYLKEPQTVENILNKLKEKINGHYSIRKHELIFGTLLFGSVLLNYLILNIRERNGDSVGTLLCLGSLLVNFYLLNSNYQKNILQKQLQKINNFRIDGSL